MADQFHERQWAWNVDANELQVRAADDGDGLTLSGYIARFGQVTEIEDWLGRYTEEIKRGAFAKTIAERGPAKIKMQFNHGHDPAFGALPIGVWTDLREDRKGLFGEGRIHDTWHTIPIRAAIESGALDGMSFKFRVIGENWRKAADAKGVDHRQLTEIALHEAGVVVNQAYEGTTVGIRSRALDLYRSQFRGAHGDIGASSGGGAATIEREEKAVAPAGDTGPATRTEADPPDGITRQQMRDRVTLALLGVFPNDQDRVA